MDFKLKYQTFSYLYREKSTHTDLQKFYHVEKPRSNSTSSTVSAMHLRSLKSLPWEHIQFPLDLCGRPFPTLCGSSPEPPGGFSLGVFAMSACSTSCIFLLNSASFPGFWSAAANLMVKTSAKSRATFHRSFFRWAIYCKTTEKLEQLWISMRYLIVDMRICVLVVGYI